MRRLVIALSLSTLLFAVSTAYLARALYLERGGGVATPATPPTAAHASTNASAAESGPAAARNAAPAAGSTASAAAPSAAAVATGQPRQSEVVTHTVSQASPDAARMLAQLQDPAEREKLMQQRKSMTRMIHKGLAEYLHMDDAEFERFIDMKARHELSMQEAGLRCYRDRDVDAACMARIDHRSLHEAQQREMADLFGQEKMDAFEFYQRTMNERQTVTELRSRLPDKYRLMDSQSDALVTALHEERQRIQRDSRQRGVHLSSFNNLIYTTIPEGGPDAKAAQAAEDYNRMLRDRASTILTPEQLTAFEKMQREAKQTYQDFEDRRSN